MAVYDVIEFDPAQTQAVQDLHRGIYRDELHTDYDPTTADDMADIARAYAPDGNRFLVAMTEGQVVATGAILRISDADCELRWLGVRQDHRREGLMSTIFGKLLPFIQEQGYRRILLEIRADMAPYAQVYRRYGFAEVSASSGLPRQADFMAIDI